MDVQLLAYSMITPQVDSLLKPLGEVEDADFLAEVAGRDCYQSFDRPNPLTAQNEDYIAKNLIGKKHFSVLEHASATLRFVGVSRSFTHELVRHRHFSFSQLSQRYVDITDMQMVIPPLIRDWDDAEEREQLHEILDRVWDTCSDAYQDIEDILSRSGKTARKKIREAARAVMPNDTDTIIIVTGNHRAWREFLGKRLSPHADAEMQEVAAEVLRVLMTIAPHTYSDFVPAG